MGGAPKVRDTMKQYLGLAASAQRHAAAPAVCTSSKPLVNVVLGIQLGRAQEHVRGVAADRPDRAKRNEFVSSDKPARARRQ